MTLSKRTRRILRIGGGAAGLVLLLFLLRWPLFGGLIRSGIAGQVRSLLKAEVRIGGLHGSLITGLTAEDVRLQPLDGSPLGASSARRIEISYGLFGLGDPDVRIREADIVLAAGAGPAVPLHTTLHEASSIPFSLQVPGVVRIRDSQVRRPDGLRIRIDSARLEGSTLRADLRADLMGRIEAVLSTTPCGALEFTATAEEGPVSRLELRLSADGSPRALEARARIGERFLAWRGTAALDEQRRLTSLHGELTGDEGRISTSVNLLEGTAAASGRVSLHVRRDGIDAHVTLQGSAKGPISGPADAWRFHPIRVDAKSPIVRGVQLDEITVRMPGSRGADFPVVIEAVRGTDRCFAEGIVTLGSGFSARGEARFEIADLAPYLDAPEVRARAISGRASGTFESGRLSISGHLDAGPGRAGPVAWSSLGVRVTGRPPEFTVRELRLDGMPRIGRLDGSGTVRVEADRWIARDVRLRSGSDVVELDGEYSLASFEVRARIDAGPVDAAGVRVAGTRTGSRWRLVLDPGSLRVEDRRIRHDSIQVLVEPGLVELKEAALTVEPDAGSLKVSGGIRWTEDRIRGWVEARDLRMAGEAVPGFRGEVTAALDGSTFSGDFAWGHADGNHFIARAKVDGDVDVRVSARIRDVARLPLRPPGVQGGIALEARVTGSRENPRTSGSLRVHDFAAGPVSIPSIEIPLRTEDQALSIPTTRQVTPYGSLTLEGRIPFPWTSEAGPAEARAIFEIGDPAPILAMIPEDVRRWIPPATGRIEATARGPLPLIDWKAEADFECGRHEFPKPVGELTGLQVSAAVDASGVTFRSIEGALGDGPFKGAGRWTFVGERPGLKLRLAGTELLAASTPLVRVRVSPRITITVDEDVTIAGEVEVPFAMYFEEFGEGGGGTGGTFGINLPRSPHGGLRIPGIAGLSGVKLDLHAVSGREVRIQNSTIGLMVQADVRLRGTADAPALTGVVRARRGEVRLATGLFLRIVSGRITMPGEPARAATIAFEGMVGTGATAITVSLSGALADPTLSLRSTPPRPQDELLAMIAFGHLPGTVEGGSAIGVVTGKILETLTDAWPDADPDEDLLDRIRLEVVQEQAAASARVPWALPVRGSARGPVVRTEYRLNEHFSILAESDQEANLSGDVRYRIRFRF